MQDKIYNSFILLEEFKTETTTINFCIHKIINAMLSKQKWKKVTNKKCKPLKSFSLHSTLVVLIKRNNCQLDSYLELSEERRVSACEIWNIAHNNAKCKT
jgi:hypothetical protein